MNTPKFQNGLTLIELMVVMAILAIVSAIAIPSYNGYIQTSRVAECINEVAIIQTLEVEYSLNNNGDYFEGVDAGALKTDSGDLYIPSISFTNGTANCGVAATDNGDGTFTITATGTNKLPNTYSLSITGP